VLSQQEEIEGRLKDILAQNAKKYESEQIVKRQLVKAERRHGFK